MSFAGASSTLSGIPSARSTSALLSYSRLINIALTYPCGRWWAYVGLSQQTLAATVLFWWLLLLDHARHEGVVPGLSLHGGQWTWLQPGLADIKCPLRALGMRQHHALQMVGGPNLRNLWRRTSSQSQPCCFDLISCKSDEGNDVLDFRSRRRRPRDSYRTTVLLTWSDTGDLWKYHVDV